MAKKDIKNKKYIRYKDGAEMYSMSVTSFSKLAREAGAIYKIRNIVLVNTEILDEYLEAFKLMED